MSEILVVRGIDSHLDISPQPLPDGRLPVSDDLDGALYRVTYQP